MKIGGVALEEDLRRIEAVLGELTSRQRLAVDANGRFDRDGAIAYGKALSQYGLFWYEETGDPLDFELQAELAKHYAGSMATGEKTCSPCRTREISSATAGCVRTAIGSSSTAP